MADAKQDVVVSVDVTINEAINAIVNNIFREHGIRVETVNIDWNSVEAMSGDRHDKIRAVRITSTTFPRS